MKYKAYLKRHTTSLTLRKCIIVAAMIVLIFSSYKILSYAKDSYVNNTRYSEMRSLYNSAADAEPVGDGNQPIQHHEPTVTQVVYEPDQEQNNDSKPQWIIQDKFKPLLEKNEDIVGWVKIDGTAIDYPVAQAANNEYYLDNDIFKESNIAGSIFMDFRNSIEEDESNTILYGHNMKNGSMFGDLLWFESKWNFENHSIIQFDTLYGTQTYEIFSAYVTDTQFDYIKTDFSSKEEYKQFLNVVKEKSLHKSDVDLTENDTIITLSTCSYAFENARFVVHARLIAKS